MPERVRTLTTSAGLGGGSVMRTPLSHLMARSVLPPLPRFRPVGRCRDPPRLELGNGDGRGLSWLPPGIKSWDVVFWVGDTGCEMHSPYRLVLPPCFSLPRGGSWLLKLDGLSDLYDEDMAESIDPLCGVGVLLKDPVLSKSEEANAFKLPLLSW